MLITTGNVSLSRQYGAVDNQQAGIISDKLPVTYKPYTLYGRFNFPHLCVKCGINRM
jgi:hypothetical protein